MSNTTSLVPLTKMRSAIAQRMTASKTQAPHVYRSMDMDCTRANTELDALNGRQSERADRVSISAFRLEPRHGGRGFVHRHPEPTPGGHSFGRPGACRPGMGRCGCGGAAVSRHAVAECGSPCPGWRGRSPVPRRGARPLAARRGGRTMTAHACTKPSPLRAMMNSAAIAVLDASSNPAAIGGRPIHLLQSRGYKGTIYPVNPNRDLVQGLRAFRP